MRIGFGEDTHRLVPDRRLVLGGVEIKEDGFDLGLLGHSDADVLVHAIIDSLLGAAALGDIGKLFPDTDIRYKDANSLLLLSHVMSMVKNAGYGIINTDSVIIAQKPKLSPYIDTMRNNIAQTLSLPLSCVSVKATTPEHVGPEGRLEAITVRTVSLIDNK